MLLEFLYLNVIYILARGMFYPYFVRKTKLKRLLPYRWILIGTIGWALDASKYLGYIFGSIKNLLTQSINVNYNLK